ncbi:MAG: DUF1415 domain-containing protein [Pseudomonadota bacterium]
MDGQQVITHTQRWLERAVIGLNLCPFAKAVHVKQQIHYAVSAAVGHADIRAALVAELRDLLAHNAGVRDTTLLILPNALPDFLDFNDFLGVADRTLAKLKLDGVVQIASFHPAYQFADAAPDDMANCTNRAPYPILHLLREDSVARAVAAFPEAESIYARNIATLQQLGPAGWAALGVAP